MPASAAYTQHIPSIFPAVHVVLHSRAGWQARPRAINHATVAGPSPEVAVCFLPFGRSLGADILRMVRDLQVGLRKSFLYPHKVHRPDRDDQPRPLALPGFRPWHPDCDRVARQTMTASRSFLLDPPGVPVQVVTMQCFVTPRHPAPGRSRSPSWLPRRWFSSIPIPPAHGEDFSVRRSGVTLMTCPQKPPWNIFPSP